MAKAKSSHLDIDRMICGLRWAPLLLTPVLSYLGWQEVDLALILGLTFGGMLYNLAASLLAYLGFFPPAATWSFLALDSLLSLGFLVATNFQPCVLFTLGLFTVLEAALRFDLVVGLVEAVIIAFATGLGAALVAGGFSLEVLWPAILGLAALSMAAGSAGALADRIGKMVAHARDQELAALRRTNERAQAIYQMSSALSSTLDYEQAMEATLDIGLMGLEELGTPGNKPVGLLLLYGPEGMYVATSRNLRPEDADLVISGQDGFIADTLSADGVTLGRNLFRDPELSQFASLRLCRSAICVPLRVGLDTYGVVLVGSPEIDAFADEHKELMSSICAQAVMALQNAQLYLELREERDKIIDQQEEARAQLARDLHDGPTQGISAIAMRLNYVKALLHRDPLQARKEMDDLEALARRTTREIRTMLFTLRPQILESQGLVAAVEHYISKVQEDADFEIHLEAMDLSDALDINTQAVAFNIIEETINNVKKHAECENVWIRLALKKDFFVTQIQDDGKGFDVEATMASYDQRGSMGLLNLYERAQLVEGKTEIVSAPGKGTKVTLIVPLVK
jgi:signal transduction histidine kinase